MSDATLTKDEIKATINDLVATRAKVDAEWAEGKRDMLRANIHGIASDLQRMVEALDADDPNAFRVAASECREHASALSFHSLAWLRKHRGETP